MSGSFSSEAQSQADPKNYFPIELHMRPIWQGLKGEPWLYVEQATAAKPDRPYRQRVYRLRPTAYGRFAGATEGPGCASELAGASYATSEVVLTSQQISSWDRGFDSTGKQVWGAELGPYLFVKQAALDVKIPAER